MHPCLPSPLAFFLFFLFLVPYVVCFNANHPVNAICENRNGNYTIPSTYKTNLNDLFSSLSTQTTISAGFSESTAGASPDQVWGLILCRGDVNYTTCGSCIKLLLENVNSSCPNQKDAIIWFDYCYIRYSQQNFLSEYNNSYDILYWNGNNVTTEKFPGWDASNATISSTFKVLVQSLLEGTREYAVNTTNRFGTGLMDIPNSPNNISGLTQCTPDMPKDYCSQCLHALITETLESFDGSQGSRILGDRCNIRYEMYSFFFGEPNYSFGNKAQMASPPPPTSSSSPPLPPPPPPVSHNIGGIKIAIISGNVAIVLVLVGFSISFRSFVSSHSSNDVDSQELAMLEDIRSTRRNEDSGPKLSLFSFSQIESATNNFGSILGQGGFGPVFKGVLPDGLEVAVKRLAARSGQGLVEFKNEIQLIARVQHVNLVRLVGWCVRGEEKLLVYEFLPNKSLDHSIFDETKKLVLNWEKRFQIIDGIVQGLIYLHKHSRPRIIHRDLKQATFYSPLIGPPRYRILGWLGLLVQINWKEMQLGLLAHSKLYRLANQLEADQRRISHTGYMAPEYATEGRFSVKSDVFSFGVMLLEIVSGKKNMGFHLGYTWKEWREGNWLELVDISLTKISEKQIERCIHVALLCVQENPIDRPTMSDVTAYLSTESILLPEPKQPAYFNVRIAEGSAVASSDFDASVSSLNDTSIVKTKGR